MKKLLLFLVLVYLVLNVKLFSVHNLMEFNFAPNANVVLSSKENVNLLYASCVSNGNEFIYETKFSNARKLINSLNTYSGVTVECLNNDFSINNFLNNFNYKIVERIEHDNFIELLLYSKNIAGAKNVNGTLVNTQIAIYENRVVVGSPLILQSF